MDAKIVYWTGAFINFGLITALAIRGVRQIRRGDLVRHRRSMLTCVALVGAFLVSYGVKLAVLGRENLAAWSGLDRGILRFHPSGSPKSVVVLDSLIHRFLLLDQELN